MRAKKPGVYGPYAHRRKWRVITIRGDGRSRAVSFESWQEAHGAAEAGRRALNKERLTVSIALDQYEEYQARKGNKPGSIKTTRYRLDALLELHAPVTSVNAKTAQRLYDRLVDAGTRTDTHRNTLGQVKTFWRWLIKRGYVKSNPWESVEPVGRRSKGKPQLTIDQARTLARFASRGAGVGETGVLLSLLCGLRASEVCALQRQHVDDGGRVLRVPGTKSETSVRRVAVPDVLQGSLAERLPVGVDRHQLLRAVKATMREAGVPEVSLHGLRGTHATLATEVGMASQAVASALGHASDAVTKGHYIAPGTVEAARQRAALRVLDGGSMGNRRPDSVYPKEIADPECESEPAKRVAKSSG